MILYCKMCRPYSVCDMGMGFRCEMVPLDSWYPEEEEGRLRKLYEPQFKDSFALLEFRYKYVEVEER